MSNYTNAVEAHSAQSANYSQTSGLAPGQSADSAIALMFGPATSTESRKIGWDTSSTHEDFWQAYEGENLYLADTIVGFVLRNIEWYTSLVPWLRTSQQHIKWNTFEFNRTLAQAVPAEGISRIISHKTRENSASVSRFGIAFIMEGDFIDSEEGRVMYRRNIQGISQACLETVNYHTVWKLLTCKNSVQQRQDLHRADDSVLDKIAEIEALEFGTLAYHREGFSAMIERAREMMRDHDGEADSLIVFPKFTWYNDMILQGTYTQYYATGPRGMQILTRGPVAPATFRGIPVFESSDFNAYSGGMRVQPMSARRSIGEYYPMTFESFRKAPLAGVYESRWRDVAVYDIKADAYRKITLKDAFLNARMFGGNRGDEDGLAPSTYALMQDLNEQFSGSGGFEDEAAIYGNPAELENTDTVRPARRVYMHLSHNVNKRGVEPVKKFSEFDIDVIPTNDFLQVADTVVGKMHGAAEAAKLREAIRDAGELLDRLSSAPYSKAFLEALANENIDQSVGPNGEFVGAIRKDLSEVIDWNPNAYGGLDLPTRAGNAFPVEGFGLGNYGGIATLAAQGQQRGYEVAGDNLIALARKTVAMVKRIKSSLSETIRSSEMTSSARAAEWIRAARSEAAVFEALFITRPPMFLGVPAGLQAGAVAGGARPDLVDANGVPVEQDEEDAPLLWQGGRAGTAFISSTVPRQAIIANILGAQSGDSVGTLAASLGNKLIDNSPLDLFVQALFADAGPTKIKEAEELRAEIVDGLYDLFELHKGKAENAPLAANEADKFVNDKLKVADAKLANKDKIVSDLAAAIKAAPAAIKAELKKLGAKSSAAYVANKDFGEVLLKFASGVAVAEQSGGGGALPSAAQLDAIAAAMAAPIRANSDTPISAVLTSMRSEFEARGMSLAGIAGRPFSMESYNQFVDALAVNGADRTLIDGLEQSRNEYVAVLADIDARVAAAAASVAPSAASFGALPAGNQQATDRAVVAAAPAAYFRAPLAMSNAALASLAAVKDVDPMVLPADPKQDYRAYVAPTQGSAVDSAAFLHISADPLMAQMVGGTLEAGAKVLANSPQVRALKSANEWYNPHADFRHVRAGTQGNDTLSVGMKRLADGRVVFEHDAAIAANLEKINAERAARGQAPRPIGLDIANANEQRAAAEREYHLAQQRAAALTQLSQTGIHAAGNNTALPARFNPVARAAAMTHGSSLAAPIHHVSEQHAAAAAPYRHQMGAYAGSRSSRTGQFQLNKHNDQLPDPAYMREPRTYYYDTSAAHADAHHPHGYGHGYDHSRGYAVAGEQGMPMSHGYHGHSHGAFHGYDRHGQPMYAPFTDSVQLGRDGQPLQPFTGGSQELEETDESAAMMHPNSVYRYARAQQVSDPLRRVALLALYEMPNKLSSWTALIDADIHVPINFLVWRLHIEFDMYSCILLQSGIEMGANLLGKSNMVFTNSGGDKMMHGHLTFHHATVIFNEKLVHILKDVYPRDYIAGWDTTWIMTQKELSEQSRGSLISTAMAITETIDESKVNFVDTTKPRLLKARTNRSKSQRALPDYSGAAFYEKIWGLSGVALAKNSKVTQNFGSGSTRVNVVARRGKCFLYSPQSGSHSIKITGTSGLSGDRTGPGVARVWKGTQRDVCADQLRVEQSITIR